MQLARLKDDHQAWYKDVHTVATAYSPGPSGSGVLTGMDFLRTPGFGEYTFGIGLRDDTEGQIAAQAGIWSLSRTGNTIQAKFGDLFLTGDIENAGDCHSIVVSGVFGRQVSSAVTSKFTLALYIDGAQAQSATSVSVLPVTDPTIETVIGDPGISSNADSRAPPIILNTALSASTTWKMESFSQALCNDS